MFYVIYVGAGKERNAETCIRKMISRRKVRHGTAAAEDDLCTSCFYPVRHMRRKIRGNWTDCYERMIPGYVFVESEHILELYGELCRVPFFMKLLGKEPREDLTGMHAQARETGETTGDENEDRDDSVRFQALRSEEVRWLHEIMGNISDTDDRTEGNPVVELSQVGFDENDQVKILSGPMESMAGQIRKINLHRRTAEVEVEFMGRKISVYLGIELLDKKE